MMNRLELINHLIKLNDYTTYLEIGVYTGEVLNGCVAQVKLGVDPNCKVYSGEHIVLCMASDDFFLTNDLFYDIIFIDGFHEASQVYRDLQNSLEHLSPNGTIVVHDCNPPTQWHTRSHEEYLQTGGDWNGNVYSGYIEFSQSHDVDYVTVDTDWGVGVLQRSGPKSLHYIFSENWSYFDQHRKELLNLISIEEFRNRFNKKSSN